jgi:hypothetical protein
MNTRTERLAEDNPSGVGILFGPLTVFLPDGLQA